MSAQKKKQYSLFEEAKVPQNQQDKKANSTIKVDGLQLRKNDTQKESRLKKLIRSRMEKIEKYKLKHEDDKKALDKMKQWVEADLKEDMNELCHTLANYTRNLLTHYKMKGYSKSHKNILEILIEENFQELNDHLYTPEEFEKLIEEYKELNPSYIIDEDDFLASLYGDEDDFDEEDFEDDDFDEDDFDEEEDQLDKDFFNSFGKDLLIEYLQSLGLKADDALFEGLDITNAEDINKFHERLKERYHQQHIEEEKEKKRKRTLSTTKEFTKLYKHLVKKVHPDLTTDEAERKRREHLMKELSTVWEKRDYYQLLLMQAQIDPNYEEDIVIEDLQLKQIADDFLEKMKEVQYQQESFREDPDHDFYFSNFYASTDSKMKKNIKSYKESVQHEIKMHEHHMLQLKSQLTAKRFLKSVDNEMRKNYNDH